MTLKVLPILNAVGCLFLVGFVVVQWQDNQNLEKDLRAARLAERITQNEKIEVEQKVIALQTDVDSLKASIELMKKEAEEKEKEIADGKELTGFLNRGIIFTAAHLQAMEKAVEERNARIVELNGSLGATRKRLDEAIAELRKAGAR